MSSMTETPSTDLEPSASRSDGVRREPTARAFELGEVINLGLLGLTYQQIADTILDPTAAQEKRTPKRASKADWHAVRDLLASPEGQKALRYAINDLQEHTDRFLVSAHLRALRVLVTAMSGTGNKLSDRIRAATAITALATKRIELSGPGGGAIDVNVGVLDALDEQIALMKERSKGIIEAYGTPIPAEIEVGEDPPLGEITATSTVAEQIAEIIATIPTPATVEETAPAVPQQIRHRQPAPIIRPRR